MLITALSFSWRGYPETFLQKMKNIACFPDDSLVKKKKKKNSTCQWQEMWVQSLEIPWRRAQQPTPVCLPGKSHGQRSLVGYNLWDHRESGTAEHTHVLLWWKASGIPFYDQTTVHSHVPKPLTSLHKCSGYRAYYLKGGSQILSWPVNNMY